MRINLNGIGFDVAVGQFALGIYLWDFHLKIPHLVEVAWNHTGFSVERL